MADPVGPLTRQLELCRSRVGAEGGAVSQHKQLSLFVDFVSVGDCNGSGEARVAYRAGDRASVDGGAGHFRDAANGIVVEGGLGECRQGGGDENQQDQPAEAHEKAVLSG